MPQILADNLKKELLSMKPEDFSVSWISKNFGTWADSNFKKHPPRFKPTDIVHLQANEYINKEAVTTTAGRILFNKLFIEGKLENIVGFFNGVITKKSFAKFLDNLAQNIMEKKMTTDEYATFITDFQFYTLKLAAVFSPSFDEALLKPNPKIMEVKEKRIKEIDSNKDLTDAQRTKAYSDLEKELTEMARKAIGDDPSMTLFDSGARGDFGTEYKVMALMGGLVPNTEKGPNQWDFMKSNYMDGLNKEEIPKAGNIVVGASYPRAVSTAVGGYKTKQFYSGYQSIVVDKPGTNCGSKFTLSIRLTPSNVNRYMYQYIVEGDKNICLLPDNSKKYIGKVVKLRTPMGCVSDKICHVCAGDRFRRLDITNIGLTTGRISNSIMDKNMQAFHQTKVNFNEADPEKLLI